MIPRSAMSRPTTYFNLNRLFRPAAASTTPLLSSTPGRSNIDFITFSEKASPRAELERPESLRGFPPIGTKSQWETAAPKIPKLSNGQGQGGKKDGKSAEETVMDFDGPSRPRLLYPRPTGRRELPSFKNQVPIYILLGLAGLSAWGLFLLYATNAERLASSVMRSLQFHLRNSLEVREILGTRVRLEEPWYVLGDPWISGSVNTMQGRVDLSFRVKGSKEAGTIYFTSIRPSQADPWRIVRYKLISDSGQTLRLENNIEKL